MEKELQEQEDKILSLVEAYKKADDLDERQKLALEIIGVVGPVMKAFIIRRCPEHVDEAYSRTLEGLVRSFRNFRGKTAPAFWSFCYRVAQNKILDQLRRQYSDSRFVPTDTHELMTMLDSAQANGEMSAGDRMDLEFLVKLLNKSKPDCFDFLYKRHVLGWEYEMIARERGLMTATARMRTTRCLEHAHELALKNP